MYNNKVDIYSLGVVLYQMLFGDYPFGTNFKAQHEILKAIMT